MNFPRSVSVTLLAGWLRPRAEVRPTSRDVPPIKAMVQLEKQYAPPAKTSPSVGPLLAMLAVQRGSCIGQFGRRVLPIDVSRPAARIIRPIAKAASLSPPKD